MLAVPVESRENETRRISENTKLFQDQAPNNFFFVKQLQDWADHAFVKLFSWLIYLFPLHLLTQSCSPVPQHIKPCLR